MARLVVAEADYTWQTEARARGTYPLIVLAAPAFTHEVDEAAGVWRFRMTQGVLEINDAGLLPLVTWPGHE